MIFKLLLSENANGKMTIFSYSMWYHGKESLSSSDAIQFCDHMCKSIFDLGVFLFNVTRMRKFDKDLYAS
jgi:hypothetical protein